MPVVLQEGKSYIPPVAIGARMEGIVVFDYADRYHLAVAEMAGYLKDGRMKSKEAPQSISAAYTRSRNSRR